MQSPPTIGISPTCCFRPVGLSTRPMRLASTDAHGSNKAHTLAASNEVNIRSFSVNTSLSITFAAARCVRHLLHYGTTRNHDYRTADHKYGNYHDIGAIFAPIQTHNANDLGSSPCGDHMVRRICNTTLSTEYPDCRERHYLQHSYAFRGSQARQDQAPLSCPSRDWYAG